MLVSAVLAKATAAEKPSLTWRLCNLGTPKGNICSKMIFLPCAILQISLINPRYQQERAGTTVLLCFCTTYQVTATAGGKKIFCPFPIFCG